MPPAFAVAELAAATAPLQAAAAAPGLRWESRERWHLTMAFLGEVGEDKLTGLQIRLERAASRHPQQLLAFTGGGAFPRPHRARVLWAGVQCDRSALSRLAASVAAGARRAGAPPPDEARKYHPHLTLARCSPPADVAELASGLAGFTGTPWLADSICLMHSQLSGGAPRYHTVASWPLRRAPAGEPRH